MGQYEAALDDVEKASKLSPHASYDYSVRASLLADQGRFEDAIREITDAIDSEPDDVAALRTRANLYRFSGRYDDALCDLKSIIELGRESGDDLIRAGELLRMLGRTEEARSMASRGAAAETMYGWGTFSYGLVLLVLGEAGSARKEFIRARIMCSKMYRRMPFEIHIVFNLAIFCAASGHDVQARRLFVELKQLKCGEDRREQARILLREVQELGIATELKFPWPGDPPQVQNQ
jgi:tetratricopeptide (TPR) repeat protein